MLKTYIFDLDGTLVDTLDLLLNSFKYALDGITDTKLSYEDIIRAFFIGTEIEILKHFAGRKNSEVILKFYQYYETNHDKECKTFAGINLVLAQLKKGNKNLSILTGKHTKSASITLKKLGFQDYFDYIVTGDMTKNKKPDPEGLHLILNHFKSLPSEAIFIGDTTVDIMTGKNAKIKTGAVLWGITEKKELVDSLPDFIFKSPEEILSIHD